MRKGDFVGVVAEREWDAVKAAQQLKVTWRESTALPGNAGLFDHMRAGKSTDTVIADWGDATKAFGGAAHVASATYRCPYQSHAPFGPNCALADVGPNGAVVMSSTQDIYNSRAMLAEVLGLPVNKVRVQYHEGSGTFGRSCYEDAAQAAAVMSQAVGQPVRVQFMRWDELGWDDYGPAHLADVRAAIDASGKLVAYEYHGWQHGWMINETTHELVLLTPPKERASGPMSIPVNRMSTGSMYAVANRRVVSHAVPMVGYLKGAPLRSPLDLSFAFASEQTIDELAVAAKLDPLEFRRKNIGDQRWLGVLNAAAAAAGWQPKVSGSALSTRRSSPAAASGSARTTCPMAPRSPTSRSTGGPAISSPSASTPRSTPARSSIPRWSRTRSSGSRSRPQPHAQGGGHLRQERRHQPRLGVISGAALRRASRGGPGRGPAPRRAVDRRRRGGDGRDHGRDRQRLLRCHRRAAAAISDDARTREGGARGQDLSGRCQCGQPAGAGCFGAGRGM